MRATATFRVSARPDAILAYLSEARHVIVANHTGPIVDRSQPPVEAGSWAVLALDQLRVRIEYSAFGPTLVAGTVTYSGHLSGDLRGTFEYHLAPEAGSGGTTVRYVSDSSMGLLLALVARLNWPLYWRRIRTRMNDEA